MIVEETDWGILRGKMKLTPEQAKEMLNYDLPPEAKGVIFQIIRGKQIVRSAMPHRIIDNETTMAVKIRHGALGKISALLLKDIIHPNWEPMVKGRALTGSNLFHQYNCSKLGIPANWKKLTLTKGTISAPEFTPMYCPRHKLIALRLSVVSYLKIKENLNLNAAVFNPRNLKLHFPVEMPKINGSNFVQGQANRVMAIAKMPFELTKRWSAERKKPVIITYCTTENEGKIKFSDSNTKELQSCKNIIPTCNKKNVKHHSCPFKLGYLKLDDRP